MNSRQAAQLVETAAGNLELQGEVLASTVDGLLSSMEAFFLKNKELHLSLAKVTRSDSAALSLLVEFIRMARRRKVELRFSGFPQPMLDLAQVVGVDTLVKDFHG